jgi:AsmA protein
MNTVMKKMIKWILRIALTLVLLLVIAAFVLPMVIDPNDYKDTIENKVQETIGRQIHLNGEIQWKVFPWLALTFNDVKVDNAKGFKGESLASIQKLSARVKILPLLSKEIQVGKVALDDAQFNLQVSKKGNSNWQSILTHLNNAESQTTQTSNETNSGKLNIAGIDLNNIKVNYADSQNKTTANLNHLMVTVGEIKAGQPVDLDASLHLNMPETGLDVDVTTDITVSDLLAASGLVADINAFSVNGKMSTQSVMPLTISLEKTGQVNLAKDTLSLPEIKIKMGEAELSTNLSGKNISQSKQKLSGSFSLDSFDLNEFLKELTGAYFVTNDSFKDFSSTGSWSLSGKRLTLADLKINYSDTKIDGNADIKNVDKMVGSFDLHINQFNVDDFLGDEKSTSSSDSSTASSDTSIDFGHLRGSIAIDKLSASGTKMDNIKVKVKTNGAKMLLDPIKADFYQGKLITAIKIDTKAKTNRVIVEHDMTKIHAGPLITDLAGSELLTGIGDLSVDLKIDKPFSEIPLKTAHGSINYTLGDGAIYGVDVFGMMQKGLSMLYPEVKAAADGGVKKTSFALMQIDADIDKGILTTNTLKIESPYLRVNGDVTIDLVNMTIDGTIEPMLLDIPEQLVSDKYKKLLNIAIPVSLSGSLLEPNIKIDAKKLLLASQKERIDKEKDKLKGKLLDSLFGKDKKKSQTDENKDAQEEQQTDKDSETKDDENLEEKEPESDKDKLKEKLLDGIFG